jgi:hypothetical protein
MHSDEKIPTEEVPKASGVSHSGDTPEATGVLPSCYGSDVKIGRPSCRVQLLGFLRQAGAPVDRKMTFKDRVFGPERMGMAATDFGHP